MIEYILIRSDRKTVSIQIRSGTVEVRAPKRLAKREIDRILLEKEKWITDKLRDSMEREENKSAFNLNYGDTVTVAGADYPIKPREGNTIGFNGEEFYMPPRFEPDEIKRVCVKIYRSIARAYIKGRIGPLAIKMGVRPERISINGAKTRWGSCGSNGNLNFSWYLMMAGEDVIDYVIVHELAHLTEMNHSARFWAIVEKIIPDYKNRQKDLKLLQQKLSNQDWGK